MKLSIIIVSWNTAEILDNCLRSVKEQVEIADYEIIVIDNNSEDDSVQLIKTKYPNVNIIENKKNLGFAAANNQGIKFASGEYFLFLNSDTIVLGQAIDKTLAYLSSKLQTGMVSCKILNADRSLQTNCSMFPSILNLFLFTFGLSRLFPRNKFFGREKISWWTYESNLDVDVLSGCFMLVRSEVIQQVGGMDAEFFMYSEEVDWCYRIKQAGWDIKYFPGAEIIHLGGASAAKLGASRALIKDRSSIRYMKKHWRLPARIIGYALMILFYLSRLPPVYILSLVSSEPRYKVIKDNHIAGLLGLLSL